VVEQALAKRQARALVGAQVRSGDLLVDLQRGQATLQGETLPLTSQESEVLVCLARRQGEVVSYETLCQEVWGCDDLLDKGVVQRTVSRLRDKIGEARIICHWGQGYRLA
ncbi:MAG TPA: winged helix family transcriptional regulator, partial [Chloroflexi bacterium]|nr:winged helix family transcriptional regulator [Chloroflexota bacterium]